MTSSNDVAHASGAGGGPDGDAGIGDPGPESGVIEERGAGRFQSERAAGTAGTLLAALQTVPPERRASWRMHKVESGETLATIGKRYGATPSVIAAVNRIESDGPVTGDLLVIPQATVAPVALRKPAARPRLKAHGENRSEEEGDGRSRFQTGQNRAENRYGG